MKLHTFFLQIFSLMIVFQWQGETKSFSHFVYKQGE